MPNITIHDIEPAKRKDGTEIKGTTKNGSEWKLFRINNKYSFFHYGEGEPDFKVGDSHDFILEEQQSGGFTNYTISLPRNDENEQKSLPLDDMKDVKKAIGKLQKQVNQLETNYQSLKEFLDHS